MQNLGRGGGEVQTMKVYDWCEGAKQKIYKSTPAYPNHLKQDGYSRILVLCCTQLAEILPG